MKQQIAVTGWFIRQVEAEEVPAGKLAPDSVPAGPGDGKVWYPAPGACSVHEVLYREGLIGEEIFDGAVDRYQWIGASDWIYTAPFSVPEEMAGRALLLRFSGLDTVAKVFLNGRAVTSSRNMFLPLEVDVTGKVLAGENVLTVYFTAAPRAAKLIRAEFPDDWRDLIAEYAVLRKSPLDFGDFGHVTVQKIGLTGDVVLFTTDPCRIDWADVTALPDDLYEHATVRVDLHCKGRTEQVTAKVSVTGPDGDIEGSAMLSVLPDGTGSCRIKIQKPQLWWPKNYGGQPLYTVQTLLFAQDQLVDSTSCRVGIRRLEHPGDMRFRVNGKEIKIWGGNIVPFQGLSNGWEALREKALHTLRMVDLANCNCIRLWGGGMPYGDELYERADELGIFVWQDFFLWWDYYPETEEYHAFYRAEAEYHVKRLKHHPCILLWCAGNEIMMSNQESHLEQRDLSYAIFREDYKEPCTRLDPDRLYLPTTPTGGAYPNDPSHGDTHPLFYTFRHANKYYPNFVTEDARSAIGPVRSLRRFMTPEELWPEDYRNSLPYDAYNPYADSYAKADGIFFISEWRKLPFPKPWWNHSCNYFGCECARVEQYFDARTPEELVYRINMACADYFKETIGRVRCGRPFYDLSGPRRCGGFLVWKFNETWPQLYASMIDSFGEPNEAFYQVKRSFSPVLLHFEFDDHILLWGVNDTAEVKNGTICLLSFSQAKNQIIKKRTLPVSIAAGESKVLTMLDELCPIQTEQVLYASLLDSDGRELARTVSLMDIERNQTFPQAKLSLFEEDGALWITTDRFARCVELSFEDGASAFERCFEDNYFDLFPFEKKRIAVSGEFQGGIISAKAQYSPHQTMFSFKKS